ncbi:MAG: APC family permease [Spirochaetes bacterium]|jgi:amino acid transporter|nr:APC family permease [Spirochaetota bacterium]
MSQVISPLQRIKRIVIGKARDPNAPDAFHKLSLIAFFAWVGLGTDGITSSCYGPEEAFRTLQNHHTLAIFVALCTVITIIIISISYLQIIDLFPTGGGGYIVATKLLSPSIGMVSGCALIIDYLLTITLSVASGADAIFSFLPQKYHGLKLIVAVAGVIMLIILNMRGVKESVLPLVPIFIFFIITHVFIIFYAIGSHMMNFSELSSATSAEITQTHSQLGWIGMIILILRSYSMGAGTFTGIEAVSNGIPILREPKVVTAKHTMRYMAASLAFMVVGLMIAYLLFKVEPKAGKTLNAILFESATSGWPGNTGPVFVLSILISEAVLLFVAAQTGFLDGPRVLSNMAMDRWFPAKFAMLSDRLVTQNGILIIGTLAIILMILTGGSVQFLVVLYSINVFVTFSLSQLGMVRHWWQSRKSEKGWFRKLVTNSIGLVLTTFILVSVTILKFNEGGWITIFITGSLVALVVMIKRHYIKAGRQIKNLDRLIFTASPSPLEQIPANKKRKKSPSGPNIHEKTAVLLVNGFTGLGLHSLFNIFLSFGDIFKNFVFVQVGQIDASIFKSHDEIERLNNDIRSGLESYVHFLRQHGYYAESLSSISTDVVEEIAQLAPGIKEKFPHSVFFGGQIVFPKETFLTKLLHNYTAFATQRRLYELGIPFVLLPIKV